MSIKLKGSTDGSVSLDAPADTSPTGTDVSLTLPTSAGSANQFIKNGSTAGELEHSSMVEDSSGRLLVGTSSVIDVPDAAGTIRPPGLQRAATTYANTTISCAFFNPASNSGALSFTRSNTTTLGGHVIASQGQGMGVISFAASDGSAYIQSAKIEAEVDGTPGANDMPGRLVFSTTADGASSPTERMRIDSNGSIFSGTTTNFPGVGNTNTGFMLEQASDGKTAFISRNDNVALYLNRNTNGTLVRFHRSGTEEGYITIDTTAISLVSTSDYRLKENVVSIADGITRVKQLQPKRFNFIADPSKTVDGFMAHEVQTVVPEAAFGEHDAVDAEGNPEYQGLDQSKLIPLLTAALQEAIAKIETLETKVAALEAGS